MKKKKNKARQESVPTSARPKISQRLLEFAGEFIGIGGTLEDRERRLTAACCAWNIACNRPELRQKHLDHFMREFVKFNPNIDGQNLANIRSDLEKLIEVKLKMFPQDLRQVVGARIVQVGGKDRIEAAAVGVE
jgi:hypothetical protein